MIDGCEAPASGAVDPKAAALPLRLADGLCLAATPVFAAMALASAHAGAHPAAMLCGSAGGSWPINGMAPMYVLMSAFHAAPWLRLLGRTTPFRLLGTGLQA